MATDGGGHALASDRVGDTSIRPFPVAIANAELVDLRSRLTDVRWPGPSTSPDQGTELDELQALVEHWRDRYDWRAAERKLEAFGSSHTLIDGLDIHFLHVRSPEPHALPMLLTHGWPSSVLEFQKVIGPLADPVAHGGSAQDAFHVVVPSLPGFGFSGRPTEPGWGISRIAGLWAHLMRRLGYRHWVAQGGDFGAVVSEALTRRPADGPAAIHLNNVFFTPTDAEVADADEEELAILDDSAYWWRHKDGYFRVQAQTPQTIGYALADSPVALAGWIYPLYENQVGTRGNVRASLSFDDVLDEIMMYWLPNAGASSARLYWELATHEHYRPVSPDEPITTPAAFSLFPVEYLDASRRWVEARYRDVIHFSRPPRGGHYPALEQPELFVDELRAAFGSLR